MLSFVHWDISPVFFSIFGLEVRYYGVLFALGFLLGYYIVRYFFTIEKIDRRDKELDKLLIYVILSAVIGARLGHVIFYEPQVYLKNPLEIFAVWHGGLASHGGTIGLLIGLYLYSRKSFNRSYLYILDRIAIPTALAASFIRLGNLFNSEIYGHTTQLPWGFIFASNGENEPKHPTQIYESLSYLLLFFALLLIYRKYRGKLPRGLAVGWMLTITFSMRFLIEFIKNPQVEFEETMALNMGQLLSIPFILFGIFCIIRSRSLGPVMPNNPIGQQSK